MIMLNIIKKKIGGENFLPDQRTSLQPVAIGTQYDCPITSNAGTQTLLGGMDFSTHPTQSCSLGPPKYSTDYHDPTPLVIHRDLIDGMLRSCTSSTLCNR